MEYWLKAHLEGDRFLGNVGALSRMAWDRETSGVRRVYTLTHPLSDNIMLCDAVSPEPREFVAVGILSGESLFDFSHYRTMTDTPPTGVLMPSSGSQHLLASEPHVAEVCRRLQASATIKGSILTHTLATGAGYPVLRFPTLLRDLSDIGTSFGDGAPKHNLNMFAYMRLAEAVSQRSWYEVILPEGSNGKSVDTFEGGKWSFTPLPIYDEQFRLILPAEYERSLKGSLVKVRMTAVCKSDADRNQQAFFFDVQELTVMKRNMGF
ncbi:hypothetical protein QCA50_019364 [Cerrena zonata]|uniref:Uncharacterized protein n=1 Tax=Cerrena zonata TaxID=2478898 RepID=A0AAW0FJ83_9APHY